MRLLSHFDNGWNSELAVDNIKRLLKKTEFDLHTLVVDWEEFVDIHAPFLCVSCGYRDGHRPCHYGNDDAVAADTKSSTY